MTLTITLETETMLREKAAREGQDVDVVADALLSQVLEWEARERNEVIAAVREGLEDSRQSRVTPLAAWDARMRAKHHISYNTVPLSDVEADSLT